MSRYKNGFYEPRFPDKYIVSEARLGGGNKDNRPFYRSGWERDFMILCDVNSAISKWSSEPFPITYISPKDNKPHRYFLDFYFETGSGDNIRRVGVEVKPYAQTQVPVRPKNNDQKSLERYADAMLTYMINKAKWEAAEVFCKENDMDFVIITEKELYGK